MQKYFVNFNIRPYPICEIHYNLITYKTKNIYPGASFGSWVWKLKIITCLFLEISHLKRHFNLKYKIGFVSEFLGKEFVLWVRRMFQSQEFFRVAKSMDGTKVLYFILKKWLYKNQIWSHVSKEQDRNINPKFKARV